MDGKQYIGIKEIDEFFEELLSRCQRKDCYSVIETAKQMGVTYEEVKKWVASNENWAYILQWCHNLCRIHAEEAELSGQLSEQEAIKYLHENSNQ
jgi:hypothetical protein